MTAGPRRLIVHALVALAGAAAGARLFRLIDAHAVNVFLWDQWIYTWALLHEPGRELFASGTLRAANPAADPATLAPFPGGIAEVGGFFAQMGTWYQGLGAIVTELVYGFSRWNVRAEGFAIFGLMVVATLVALVLKVRMFGPLTITDAAIPVLFLTPRQFEIFLGVIYASHSALPLLLALVFCLCWQIERPRVRYPILLLCNFLTTFTGHGFVLGGITPMLFALDGLRWWRSGGRRQAVVAAIACVLSLATLALWYFPQAVFKIVYGCFTFPHWPLTDYLWFVGYIFTRFVGLGGVGGGLRLAVGVACVVIVAAAALAAMVSLWRRQLSLGTPQGAILILAAFGLGFCAACAIGRGCGGREAAEVSRYMTFVIPAFLAVYFTALRVAAPLPRRALLALWIAAVAASALPMTRQDREELERLRTWKQQFIDCYRAGGSAARCNDPAAPIMPPQIFVNLEWQLQELQRRRLSFFADEPSAR
jgi:hypothetical protein